MDMFTLLFGGLLTFFVSGSPVSLMPSIDAATWR